MLRTWVDLLGWSIRIFSSIATVFEVSNSANPYGWRIGVSWSCLVQATRWLVAMAVSPLKMNP